MLKQNSWTKEALVVGALKYNTSGEFSTANMSAYTAAVRKFSVKEIAPHFKRRNEWTADNIRKEAAKYSSRTEFKNSAHQANKAARALGIHEELNTTWEIAKQSNYTLTEIRNVKGIYFLYNDKEIVYIGKSNSSMSTRVQAHQKDKNKIFNKVTAYPINNDADIVIAELFLISLHNPIYNKDKGNDVLTTLKIDNIDSITTNSLTYLHKGSIWELQK